MCDHTQNYDRLSALQLAFMGDAVFSLLTRDYLLKTPRPVGDLHRLTKDIVCAKAQARCYHVLEKSLTKDEFDAMRSGRNANIKSRSKNAIMSDYRHATGVEALFGWLWVSGKSERARELFTICVEEAAIETD